MWLIAAGVAVALVQSGVGLWGRLNSARLVAAGAATGLLHALAAQTPIADPPPAGRW